MGVNAEKRVDKELLADFKRVTGKTGLLFQMAEASLDHPKGPVDEVIDLLSVGGETLERRQALPGIDPTLVWAVGRRGGQLFVVLDTDALLTPIFVS